jgi:hypothetical protein
VKNVFLHEDLLEDVYMEISPDFGTNQTMDKGVQTQKVAIWVEVVSTSLV